MPIIPKPAQIANNFGSILLIFCKDEPGVEFTAVSSEEGAGEGGGVAFLRVTTIGVDFVNGLVVGLIVGVGVGVEAGHWQLVTLEQNGFLQKP